MSCAVVVSSAWASAGPPVIPAVTPGNAVRTARRSLSIASVGSGPSLTPSPGATWSSRYLPLSETR